MRTRALAPFLFALAANGLWIGCGTRTGLLTDDGFTLAPDAGVDVVVKPHGDAGVDALDALPGIDARPPPFDGNVPSSCPDAGATLVYVITSDADLYSFYPPDRSFTRIGNVACPANGSTPFSMTVDRKGIAYVVFRSGDLYRVSTATAACASTPFVPNQLGFDTFGMGYVGDTNDAGETLFIGQNDDVTGATSQGLGAIDTTTFKVRFVGPFVPAIRPPELTGTFDGRLFGWTPDTTGGSHLYEIDKETGKILGQTPLLIGQQNEAFAFAHWGGQFWIFTAPSGQTTVTEFDPATGIESNVTTLPATVVGAGVSTCAPSTL